MKKITAILSAFLLITHWIANANSLPTPRKTVQSYISHYENVLGTSLELKVCATSKAASEKSETAVLQEITRLSKILSGYDPNSEFSRWLSTSHQAVPISEDLFAVLTLFDQWRTQTHGALDAAAQAISGVWKQAAARGRVPTPDELSVAVQEVQQTHWILNPATHTATHLTNTPLMLNSFAKSYIIKHAADAGLAAGKADAIVVNIGGDLVIAGKTTEMVQISDPTADAENDRPIGQILVSHNAVATSGNYRRGERIDGHWYSHIVDPRTGLPADNIISATVVAPNANDAGALATAFNVMDTLESIRLARSLPGVEYLIITRTGRKIASPGWAALVVPENPDKKEIHSAVTRTDASQTFGDFELLVNLEINLQKEGFVKRPYVAVWIEDTTHAPIRTVTIWHGSDRYLPELKSWYLKYRSLYTTDKNFNTSITSATRAAGKYSVKWDGKDDHGNPVKPGKYIVKIEAAREHGTYQLIRQEIACDENPKSITLTGNVEIASASLDYRKK